MFAMSYKVQRYVLLIAFLAFPLLLLAVFSFYPALYLAWLSFTSWDGYSPKKAWVGFDNYKEIFTNAEMFKVLSHNFVYFMGGIVQNVAALFFAVLLNSRLRGRNAFRAMLFLPYIMNSVAIAYMFTYVYDAQNGSLNALLTAVGLESWIKSWLGDASIVNYSLAFISAWKFMGFNMVIYLGGVAVDSRRPVRGGQNRRGGAVQSLLPYYLAEHRQDSGAQHAAYGQRRARSLRSAVRDDERRTGGFKPDVRYADRGDGL